MLQIGRFNTLTLTRFTDHGAYVDGGDMGEILVPKAYVRPEWRPGDTQRLFVYLDQSERLVATAESPLAQVGDFACLEVAWVNEHGAFLSWGVMKDLFVPFREQRRTMEVGEHHVVYVYIDEATGRLAATAKVDRYLRPAPSRDYHRGRTVQLLAWQRSPLGMKVIVDNAYAGLIYAGEAYDRLPRRGEVLEGTVVQLRPDGRLDISLQRIGKGRFRDFADVLLDSLCEAGGFLPFTDRSEPEVIAERFEVSKKTFKRAVGTLYKQHLITLSDEGIRLAAR
jgi:yitL protein